MDQNSIQWIGAPCFLRGSFAFYKSFSFTPEAGLQPSEWRLGEFYFVRCGPLEPVCIAELALLWEDRAQRHLLASSRLYFLPEDTPKGRTADHGDDEVLAVSKKIVIHLKDLVKWTCPRLSGLMKSRQKVSGHNGLPAVRQSLSPGAKDSPRDVDEGRAPLENQRVKVLSYPQYCRFRSLQRRIQDRAGYPSPQDPHLLALGGIRVAHLNTRVLYCRDTFSHPSLEKNGSVWSHIGCSYLSLKGRPCKRKSRDGKVFEPWNQNQSDSWIERMKENVMGSVERLCDRGWLKHTDKQLFLNQLYVFMERRGSPISKVPNLGFKKVDLFLLFSVVERLGGYEKVTSQRLWKQVYNELGGNPENTSAATCTRRHYEKLIMPYDQHLKGAVGAANRSKLKERGGNAKPLPKEKKPCAVERKVKPEGVNVPKRGRPRRRPKIADRSLSKAEKSEDQSQQIDGFRSSLGKPPISLQQERFPPPPVSKEPNPSSLPVSQGVSELENETSLDAPSLEKMSLPFPDSGAKRSLFDAHQLPKTDQRVKVESCDSLHELLAEESLGDISLSKDLSTLDHLRTRLGLTITTGSSLTSPDSSVSIKPPFQLVQPKAGPEVNQSKQDQISQPSGVMEDGTQKCFLNHPECVSQNGWCKLPLKILPVDIDCSLQVQQLMQTPLGSSRLNLFTRKLSEVLAQDLSKPCHSVSPLPDVPEQTLPLNLSKCSTAKRSAGDLEARVLPPCHEAEGDPMSAKRLKTEWEVTSDSGPVLQGNGCLSSSQEEPTDLSSPERARAVFHNAVKPCQTNLELRSPSPAKCLDESGDQSSSLGVPVQLDGCQE